MTELYDFTNLSHKKFWDRINQEADTAQKRLAELWERAGKKVLDQQEALDCLNALYVETHRRINEYSKKLAKNYPTKQFTPNRLRVRSPLWWVDHFTTGINQWSTLNWFSSMKIKKKSGKLKYPGASTHFIVGFSGYPFYIIPLIHGAWHEPKRNKDSIGLELVNAGKLHMKDGVWHTWSGKLPDDLVAELPPVRITPPFRGCEVMQPFTTDQIVNNIKLKRVIRAALPGKLVPERMSAHTDWREGKTDTGPLWPFADVNDAAFDTIPLQEYLFIQRYDTKVEKAAKQLDDFEYDEVDNPEYGFETPTHDEDNDTEDKILNTKEVQEHLLKLGHRISVDGKYGPQTKGAIRQFQEKWNIDHPDDQLKPDGIAGPQTCKRLKQAVKV